MIKTICDRCSKELQDHRVDVTDTTLGKDISEVIKDWESCQKHYCSMKCLKQYIMAEDKPK